MCLLSECESWKDFLHDFQAAMVSFMSRLLQIVLGRDENFVWRRAVKGQGETKSDSRARLEKKRALNPIRAMTQQAG